MTLLHVLTVIKFHMIKMQASKLNVVYIPVSLIKKIEVT